MLQKDNQLKLIHNALEKKIKNELHSMLVNDREKYEAFWKEFGRQIKFGAYSDYGMHAELLRDLLLFWSAKEQKMVTLQEYVDKMPAEQKFIYFAAGDSTDRLAKLPAAELVLDKGYDVLLLTEDVDEFCLQIMRSYPRKDAEARTAPWSSRTSTAAIWALRPRTRKRPLRMPPPRTSPCSMP